MAITYNRLKRAEERLRRFIRENPQLSQYKRTELAEISADLRLEIEVMYGLIWNPHAMCWVGEEKSGPQ